MRFEPLTPELVQSIEPWFDDAETMRYLGGRSWVRREMELVRASPGVEFRGNIVLARHVWVVFDQVGQAVGLVDVEPYDDGTAGMAFVVAPPARGRGVGREMLLALEQQPELQDVRSIIGGVEPENAACRACLARAGYTVAEVPDKEEMLDVQKKLRL